MKRTIKNIIIITIIILMSILTVLTLNTITTTSNNTNIQPGFSQSDMSNMPSMDHIEKPNKGQMPDNGNMQMPDNGQMNNMGDMQPMGQMGNMNNFTNKLDMIYYILFISESLIIASLVIYMMMSKANAYTFKETFRNTDKITIFILSLIILSYTLTTIDIRLASNKLGNNMGMTMMNDEYQADLSGKDIDKGETVNTTYINLNEYSSNVTIDKEGHYTLTGSTEYAVLVEALGEVTLTLDNISITCSNTAAIANRSTNPLNIILKGTNTLKDGGKSEYNAVVYSAGPLTIDGEGTLYAYGLQEEGIATETNDITINGGNIYVESSDDGINAGGDGGLITFNGGNVCVNASGDGIDSNQAIRFNGGVVFASGSASGGDAGIDADHGYTVNGGTVIALGSDMLTSPNRESIQNTLCITLDSVIEEGTIVSVLNESNEEIITFKANENFRTLTLSSNNLIPGTYSIYKNGTHSGTLNFSIYSGGTYTLGELVCNVTL